jgi:hypothetical protein
MELRILNGNLVDVGVIDVFDSLIWTDRYCGFGDFELTAAPSTNILADITGASYVALAESENRLMMIESVTVKSDATAGDKVIVRGKSLESILSRRIIWSKTTLTGSLQNGIASLLNDNAISPALPIRDLTRLTYEASTDPLVTALTLDKQYMGEFLYDAILDLCVTNKIGFKVTVTGTGNFLFKLYSGVDRSYGQLVNSFVVFSPTNGNLKNSEYIATDEALKTVVLVAGAGEGTELITTIVDTTGGVATDLARREMFSDGSGIEKTAPEGTLTDAEYLAQVHERADQYIAQLQEKGAEALSTNVFVESLTGELDPAPLYVYGVDYFIGDIVQVADAYGNESKSQVTELIHSQEGVVVKIYPTFTTVE